MSKATLEVPDGMLDTNQIRVAVFAERKTVPGGIRRENYLAVAADIVKPCHIPPIALSEGEIPYLKLSKALQQFVAAMNRTTAHTEDWADLAIAAIARWQVNEIYATQINSERECVEI